MKNKAQSVWGRLGLGTGTLASLGRSASLGEVAGILDAMEESGLGLIDTADSYGSGDCEVLLGRALRDRRERFRVITKAGYRHGNMPGILRPLNQFLKKGVQKLMGRQRFDAVYLERCLEASLGRLGSSFVDGFLLHDPPAEVVVSPSVFDVMAALKKRGLAQAVGISSGDAAVLQSAIETGWCDLVECPANPLDALELSRIWETCDKAGVSVIGNHIYAPSLLRIGGLRHETLMRASVGLLPPDAAVLCGTRNPTHLRQSLEWAMHPMGREEALAVANKCHMADGVDA